MQKTSYKDTIYKLVNLANHSAYQAKDSILMRAFLSMILVLIEAWLEHSSV